MRYKEIKILKAEGGISITSHGLFILQKNNKQEEIIQINSNGNECDKYDFIDTSEIHRLHFTNDYLIVSFKNGTTSFYEYNKQKVFEINKQLYFIFSQEDDIYIYIENDGNLCRFSKKRNYMDSFFLSNNYLMLLCVFNNNIVFEEDGGILSLFKNTFHNIELSWQLDLKSLLPNQEKISIKQIKEFLGSLIVVTSVATLRLSAEDGSVIWINEGYARTLEIVGNTGYICTGLSLLKLNLDNGEETGYGWEQNRLPDFTYKGQEYYPAGHEVVYHDGLLWYSVCSSGKSFLIAINPENGNYEWIHHVDTNDQTDAPQFYQDRMFLWDTGNTLHIYEKEK